MFLWCTCIKFINLSNITYKRDKINAITKRDPILYKWITIISYTLAQKTNCNWKTTCLERLMSVSGMPSKAHQRHFGCVWRCALATACFIWRNLKIELETLKFLISAYSIPYQLTQLILVSYNEYTETIQSFQAVATLYLCN